jgi:hypothetical protein
MIKPSEVTDPWIEMTIVPRALAPSIGRIAVHYAHLDHELNAFIQFLMNTDPRISMAVTQTIMSIKERSILAETFFTISQSTDDAARFSFIAEGVRLANDDRNRIIHGQFHAGNVTNVTVSTIKMDPLNKNHKMWHFDQDTLDDLEYRFIQYRLKIGQFLQKNPRWLTDDLPSLDKSPTLRLQKSLEQKQRDQKQPRQPKASKKKPPKK